VWQWIHHGVSLAEDRGVTAGSYATSSARRWRRFKSAVARLFGKGATTKAREIFDGVALSTEFKEFLTIPAYEHLD